jgi:hypothetical protein
MPAVTATKISQVTPTSEGVYKIVLETANTVDDGDTLAVDMSDYGCSTFLGVIGYTHSTEDSVVIQEQPTTSVTDGVLTLTVGGSTDNKKRVFEVLMR